MVKGIRDIPLQKITIPQLLHRAVDKFGAQEAIVFPQTGCRRSYSSFSGEIDKLATGFLALGLSKGDRVGIWVTQPI